MKNKRKGLLTIIVIIAAIAFCGYTTLVGLGAAHKGSAQNIRLGLDLAGGVSICLLYTSPSPRDCS